MSPQVDTRTSLSRRYSIGGSDARSYWVTTRPPWSAFGGKNAGKSSPRTFPIISSSSLDWSPNPSTDSGSSEMPVRFSPASSAGCCIRSCAGWRRLWTAGRSDGRGIRSEIHAAVVVLGGRRGPKYMPQLQHNMWITDAKQSVLSIITGGGKWMEISICADPLYQHLLLTAEKKFWRCVENGEPPQLFGIGPAEAADRGGAGRRYERVQFLGRVCWRVRSSHSAFLEHERAKAELKDLSARGRAAGDRPWSSCQTLEIRRHHL